MKNVEFINAISADLCGIKLLRNFLDLKMEQVDSPTKQFASGTMFRLIRPVGDEGTFAYVMFDSNFGIQTKVNHFRKLYQEISRPKDEFGETSDEVDFLIIVGVKRILIFDSKDYRKRIDLTPSKIERKRSIYIDKLISLCRENITSKYEVDPDFGGFSLNKEFLDDLFRFSINDDDTFAIRTRILRGNMLKYIVSTPSVMNIIQKKFFTNQTKIDYKDDSKHEEILSAITDTLVLRQILVRILEGRFGYEEPEAFKAVKNVGLGSTLDSAIDKNITIDSSTELKLSDSRKKTLQLDLFDAVQILDSKNEELSLLQTESAKYAIKTYGGDLYVGDVAFVATQIEQRLTTEMWAKFWHFTSSENFAFDLSDVTPSTIGEQYEQTMTNKLILDKNNELVYEKNNSEQKSRGAFYTQDKLTSYILQISLGKVLEHVKEKLIQEASRKGKVKILKTLLKMKFADLTSGGGTFLAGAVRLLGVWYTELSNIQDIRAVMDQIAVFKDNVTFQRYAVKYMIYGIDIDLKALIVSSFALDLESLGDEMAKLPNLMGRTLIHRNSVVSIIPENMKKDWFSKYKDKIVDLLVQRKKYMDGRENTFDEDKRKLTSNATDQFVSQFFRERKNTFSLTDIRNEINIDNIGVLEFDIPEVFFDEKGNYKKGFDVIFGNPPYIQLQKSKEKGGFTDLEKDIYRYSGQFKVYEASGDIYCLFFERGINLLKSGGYLCYITSNKFLRAAYGKSLRNYLLSETNPVQLVNLGDHMFGATVDTSILLIQKCENQKELLAVDISLRSKDASERLKNMSVYINQNQVNQRYSYNTNWTILNKIEKNIFEKIELYGTPLKKWDIEINYGIKTGLNDAFIINQDTYKKLIKKDPRSAEIIRPILKGKDIRKNTANFRNEYMITTFPSKKYDIDNFPAIRDYLIKNFGIEKLRQSGKKDIDGIPGNNARKKTSHKWFEVQDSIAYWRKLDKKKIMYSEIVKQPQFYFDTGHFYPDVSTFLITGTHLEYLIQWLNSDIIGSFFKIFYAGGGLGNTGYRYKKVFLNKLPIPLPKSNSKTVTDQTIFKYYHFNEEEIKFISSTLKLIF